MIDLEFIILCNSEWFFSRGVVFSMVECSDGAQTIPIDRTHLQSMCVQYESDLITLSDLTVTKTSKIMIFLAELTNFSRGNHLPPTLKNW